MEHPRCDRVPGDRHRDRGERRQAPGDLRAVPAGRRDHEPPLRRHRPRPVDQPEHRAAAGRGDPRREPAGPRQRVHAVPARAVQRPGRPGAARRCRTSRAAADAVPGLAAGGGNGGVAGPGPVPAGEQGRTAEQRPPAGDRPGEEEPALSRLLEEPPAEFLDTALSGRKVLIVDDDVRNVFALTSVLEGYGMEVLYAEDGQAGIEVLHRNPDVAVVLMDVMMPGLDGYATTAAIREMPQFAELPIIVITAKVMKGDREKSLASGASDYVPKPVDVDHLLDVMRNWLQPSIVR
ncbi:response regulator [Actinomadura madurae]|nr:response regulator [Actinomadura madurae]MCQ0021340.1 response regulator [Actinomadura madurae]